MRRRHGVPPALLLLPLLLLPLLLRPLLLMPLHSHRFAR